MATTPDTAVTASKQARMNVFMGGLPLKVTNLVIRDMKRHSALGEYCAVLPGIADARKSEAPLGAIRAGLS